MGNNVQRAAAADPPPLPATPPQSTEPADTEAATHRRPQREAPAGSASEAAAAAATASAAATPVPPLPSTITPAQLAALPPSHTAVSAAAAAAAAGVVPSASTTVPAAASYPWTQVLPVVGVSSLLLGGGLAYGISYGSKQATKVEEYAEYDVKPVVEPEVEISPEMRRLAVRRAFMAFGLGTALCAAFGIGSSYAISRHWEVYTVRDLSVKLGEVIVHQKETVMTPLNSLPLYTHSFKSWLSSTRVGQFLRISPPREGGAAGQELTAAESAELALLTQETDRMEREWEESWMGKREADKQQQAATAASSKVETDAKATGRPH